MKFPKSKYLITLAIGIMSFSYEAFAIDLYVDTKTKQIFTEPGADRKKLGSFERVEDAQKKAATPNVLPPRNRRAEIARKAETARLISKVDTLENEVKRSNKVKIKIDKKGLQAETADGNFKLKIGGRMHADAAVSGNDKFVSGGAPVEANNGTELRRARIALVGTYFKDWKFKTQIDFADNKVSVKDLKLAYTGLKLFENAKLFKNTKINVTVGHQKQAFSRELQESSNAMMFQERSVMNVLNEPTVDRAIGINVFGYGEIENGYNSEWTAQAGVYGESVSANKTSMDEGWAVNGRATLTPIRNNDNGVQKLIHLGIAGNFRETSDSGQIAGAGTGVRYRFETTHMSDLFPVDTGTLTTINNVKMIGLEANGVYGPFSVGGEYTHSWIDRHGMSTLGFHGWYGEASWSLTGESRSYKKGTFKRLKPKRAFSFANGGLGAWELAVRIAGIDLNDGAVQGGYMKNFTAALNWYAVDNVRFMFGYDRIVDISNSPLTTRTGGKPDGLNTFMFRTDIAI